MNTLSLIKQDFTAKKRLYGYDDSPKSLIKALLADGSSTTILYRFMQFFSQHRLTPLAWLCQYLNKLINGCVIGLKTEFGAGLIIVHPVGVIINSAVTAGSNIVIQSGVVIGENRGRSPTLGNNIFIGSGAKIFGDLEIGDNVAIGANAVVVKSVAENEKAFGVPAHTRKS
jgi:serine O-acetyltransferase